MLESFTQNDHCARDSEERLAPLTSSAERLAPILVRVRDVGHGRMSQVVVGVGRCDADAWDTWFGGAWRVSANEE